MKCFCSVVIYMDEQDGQDFLGSGLCSVGEPLICTNLH